MKDKTEVPTLCEVIKAIKEANRCDQTLADIAIIGGKTFLLSVLEALEDAEREAAKCEHGFQFDEKFVDGVYKIMDQLRTLRKEKTDGGN